MRRLIPLSYLCTKYEANVFKYVLYFLKCRLGFFCPAVCNLAVVTNYFLGICTYMTIFSSLKFYSCIGRPGYALHYVMY